MRLRERDGTVHLDGALGNGCTICGDSCDGEDGAFGMIPANEPINCYRCVAIIRICKRVRPTEISEDARNV